MTGNYTIKINLREVITYSNFKLLSLNGRYVQSGMIVYAIVGFLCVYYINKTRIPYDFKCCNAQI